VGENLYRGEYVSEAMQEYTPTDFYQAIGLGQLNQIRVIYNTIFHALQERVENEED
jgi:hypothetical protein